MHSPLVVTVVVHLVVVMDALERHWLVEVVWCPALKRIVTFADLPREVAAMSRILCVVYLNVTRKPRVDWSQLLRYKSLNTRGRVAALIILVADGRIKIATDVYLARPHVNSVLIAHLTLISIGSIKILAQHDYFVSIIILEDMQGRRLLQQKILRSQWRYLLLNIVP